MPPELHNYYAADSVNNYKFYDLFSCAEFEAYHTVRGYFQREFGLICSVSLQTTCILVSDSKN